MLDLDEDLRNFDITSLFFFFVERARGAQFSEMHASFHCHRDEKWRAKIFG